MELFNFSTKTLVFIYSFFGFGAALMFHKVMVTILRIVKSKYINTSSQFVENGSNNVELSKTNKKIQVSTKTSQKSFVKVLSISLLSLYIMHEYVFLLILYFKDYKMFLVENDKFLDFLTTWAAISLAYHFFTKVDSFFTDKFSFKRK